ncbi:MAG: hypothetical protein QOC92_3748 [Acidimicrobiaceae bacterium]|jgi:hypothetical protein
MGPARRCLLLAGVIFLSACGSTSSPSRAESPAPANVARGAAPNRLSSEEAAAIARLAMLSGPIDPSIPPHDHATVTLASSLPPEEQARFDLQIASAVASAKDFRTTDDATAAGYVQSSTQLPAIGTHWVRWSLVDQPFDAARPAMLLFDQSTLHPTRLAGFSYWVRSVGPPDGFAGPNDVWHRHSGLCFQNGFLTRENVPSADECDGQWLNGSDLWMLHAWVAPDVGNKAGVFAARNDDLCPPYWQQLPDLLKCGQGTSGHGDDTIVVPVGDVYCHLPST